MIKNLPWMAALVVGVTTLAACASEPEQPPAQQPPPYYQPPPQQYQPPAAQPPVAQPPVAQPPATAAPPTGTTPPPATTGAIPGIEKRPDGTCWITPPALGGQPPQPVMLPVCPPGM